jgi:hypothetical protein
MKILRVLLISWLGLSVPAGLVMGRLMARLRAPHELDLTSFPFTEEQNCAPEEIPSQRVSVR